MGILEIRLPGALTLDQLENRIQDLQGTHGRLAGLTHDGTQTVARFVPLRDGDSAPRILALALQGEAVPAGGTIAGRGQVFIEGQATRIVVVEGDPTTGPF